MKRIALFAALTCLFALWQFPGVTRADDCPGGVCFAQAGVGSPRPMPVTGPPSVAIPPTATVVIVGSSRFPRLRAFVAKVHFPRPAKG